MDLQAFIEKWAASGAAERANKDPFIIDLCAALDVRPPNPTTGDRERDLYVFERDAVIAHEGGVATVGKVDVYKHGCFILEAKQGSEAGAKKLGTAKRETPGWHIAMKEAYGQALGYAHTFDTPPPFLIACDLGYCFDLYATFDGSHDYRPFPNAHASRIFFRDLVDEKHRKTLRAIFTDPHSLDPSKEQMKVTREVASYLANLAKKLEEAGHHQELVAKFLMRCLFTMFAEDVGLLPERAFTDAIEQFWIPNPPSFPGGIESLWRAMNVGGDFFTLGKLLKFNGGLFAEPSALALDEHALRLLALAAECNWANVEPAIFGTLLERALDPKERHRLGAHFTPRAYVERLVKPTIEDPIRADWDVVRAHVQALVVAAEAAESEKTKKARINEAIAETREFHQKLCKIRVLDPACGSGNFLYVTLDLFKRIEGEVLAQLEALGEKQTLLHMETVRVTPAQFHGIEIKPWAKEIAELVLWIGYLQKHFEMYGRSIPVPEPVLRDYKNIECRDAVLAYDREELVLDAAGKPVTRWDGETMKVSPVTGEEIPDEDARLPIYRYVNPRKAEWPVADFIAGNPPFVGNKRMRQVLGDGYVDTLRRSWGDVPESADYVMYWWNKAAELLETKACSRFGLITTNSITQAFNRRVLSMHLQGHVDIAFAVPDHPWVDSVDGAQVRVAMTVCRYRDATRQGRLDEVVSEATTGDGSAAVTMRSRTGVVDASLKVGANPASAVKLAANRGLACPGVQLSGQGFVLTPEQRSRLSASTVMRIVRPYVTGRDLTKERREQYVIDTFGLDEADLKLRFPDAYQWLLDHVKEERAQNPRASYARNWWLHSEPRSKFRGALTSLSRFIGTSRTARHRVFQFLPVATLPETKVLVIACEEGSTLGILSSRIHTTFANAAGGWLGVGNDSTYNHSECFEKFPFPNGELSVISELAEELDAHRKARQAEHPDLTITNMYNVLEKLRSSEPLTAKEKRTHEDGLVSVLKKLHDDIDAAVLDAYGWPHDLTDEQILERLVALNKERADEEKRGIVRWLRPDFQNPDAKMPAAQVALAGTETEQDAEAAPSVVAAELWPKKLPDQIARVRDVATSSTDEWSVENVASLFKGARRKEVEDVLDGLVALGMLVSYELPEGKRWRAARFVG